jgi:hypothetical protein
MDKFTILSKLLHILAIFQLMNTIDDEILELLDTTTSKLEIALLNDVANKIASARAEARRDASF